MGGQVLVGALIVGWLGYHLLKRSVRVRRFARAHTTLPRWLDPWLVKSTLLLMGAGWLFAGLAQEATSHDGIATSNRRWLDDVISLRTGWLTPIAKVVTDLASGPVVYPALGVAAVVYLRRTRDLRLPLLAVLVLAVGQLVRLGLSVAFAVPRPPPSGWLVSASGHAFPSGHTASATIGYGLAALLLARADPPRRWVYAGLGALVALAVGLSRVYLGVHWPTDVLGGWTFGVAWLALAGALWRWLELRTRQATARPRAESSPHP